MNNAINMYGRDNTLKQSNDTLENFNVFFLTYSIGCDNIIIEIKTTRSLEQVVQRGIALTFRKFSTKC